MEKHWEFILQFSRKKKTTIFITTNLGYRILNEVKVWGRKLEEMQTTKLLKQDKRKNRSERKEGNTNRK